MAASCLALAVSAAWQANAQDAKSPYPTMAPLDQYLIADRNAEIVLARTAAPDSISRDAEVMVLGRHGYETAAKGKNGFVCLVWRAWAGANDDLEFWNPKSRSPVCFNPPAARFNIPITLKRTELVIAGRTKSQMFADIAAAFDKKEFPALEPGAMCYMLSKQGYLNDGAGHWHPHVMFFVPLTEPAAWGADSTDSPMIGVKDPSSRVTVLMIPVGKWSDGTSDPTHEH